MKRFDDLMRAADEAQKNLNTIHTELSAAYEDYKFKTAFSDGSLKWDEIKDIPIGEELELPSSYGSRITTVKTHQSDTAAKFIVTFYGYGILIRHNHPDCDEEIKVATNSTFKVHLGDSDREITMKYDSRLHIHSGTDHQVTYRGRDEGILEVILKKAI